jgi:Tfp pilus assembly protein PilO
VFESLPSLQSIKLKPSTMLIGLGGILIIAYALIGASYLKERLEQSSLTDQIEAGGGTLATLGDSQQTLQELRDHLDQVKRTMASLENAFPTDLDSAALVESLLGYAGQSDVRIRGMTALPPSDVKASEEQSAYTVLSYTLAVEGGLPELLGFLSLIEGGTAQTAAIGDLGLTEIEGGHEMKLGISFYARLESGEPAAAEPTPETPDTSEQSSTGGDGQ